MCLRAFCIGYVRMCLFPSAEGGGGGELTGVAVQMSSQPLAPDEWQLL